MNSENYLSISQVNKAGKKLRNWLLGKCVDPEDLNRSIKIVNEFRASYQAPLIAASMGLRSVVNTVGCTDPEVSQRLKRWESLTSKLKAQPTLALFKMQDIGGCRAVLSSIDEIRSVQSRLKHNRPVIHISDYIKTPKPSGYRGVHVVVEYGSESGRYPRRPIEIQLRTKIMHEWAIMVERLSASLAIRNPDVDLKRGRGPAEVLDILRTASEIMAADELGKDPDRDLLATFREAPAILKKHLERSEG